MTRGNPGFIPPFDPEIDRMFHRLVRHSRNLSLESIFESVPLDIVYPTAESESTAEYFVHTASTASVASALDYDSVIFHTENNMAQPPPPRERTFREMVAPDFDIESLCIQYPDEDVPFVLKTGLIHLLPKFHGLAGESPHKLVKEFHIVCSTMKPHDVPEDQIFLKAFPHSLESVAKDWLYGLAPRPVTTWDDLKRLLLEKFFPASRTTAIRKDITGIRQLGGESLYEPKTQTAKLVLERRPRSHIPSYIAFLICNQICVGHDSPFLALEALLPKAEHRFCMRHLYANFRKKFTGNTLKTLMWKAATSTYPQAWEKEMLNMKEVIVDAYKHLISIPPSVIVDARGKPIVTMLEEIRVYIMKKWATNRTKMCNMDFDICPKITKRLTNESNLSKNWIPSQDCTCKKWLISGIPCCHAIAAIRSTYDETYASIIFPVNGQHLWERTACPDFLPPFKRKLPGRPKKKRRFESWELKRDETQMTKGGHRKKCNICRVVGHNINQCPLRPQDQLDLPQPSEAPPPQPTQESTEQPTEPIRRNKLPIRRPSVQL
ncbi:hypothetical protein V8G54_036330 [Vigna mungo]|uniref:SWIM-type domain-containing protein n=1 Tax=Vigna mungo TaxID=3915 RepID=A0AAQ3MH28_VIGMU